MPDREIEFRTDTPEAIEQCLNCTKPRCTNCLGQLPSPRRPAQPKVNHDKFMELYDKGLSDGKIAAELKVDVSTIRAHRKKHNIPTKRPKNRFDEKEFRELYERGLTDGEIADALNLTTAYVCSRRNRLGLPTKHSTKRRKT